MEIILTEDVENVGQEGTLVDVKPGYARNYLIPKGLGVKATSRRKNQLEHQYRILADRRRKRLKASEDYKAAIENLQLQIPMKAGEEGKTFGSVTNTIIADHLAKAGVEIDRRKIEIEEPIHALGTYTVKVKVGPEMVADLSVNVIQED